METKGLSNSIRKLIKNNDRIISDLKFILDNEDLNDEEHDRTLERLDLARGMSKGFNKVLSLMDAR